MARCAELLNKTCDIDFIDINLGCPIDLIYKKVTPLEYVMDRKEFSDQRSLQMEKNSAIK